jgi:hypothetical protein
VYTASPRLGGIKGYASASYVSNLDLIYYDSNVPFLHAFIILFLRDETLFVMN